MLIFCDLQHGDGKKNIVGKQAENRGVWHGI